MEDVGKNLTSEEAKELISHARTIKRRPEHHFVGLFYDETRFIMTSLANALEERLGL